MDVISLSAVAAAKMCSVDGCGPTNKLLNNLCEKHYRRSKKYGITELPKKPSGEELFWTKVDKNGPIPPHRPELGHCWIWTGAKTNRGYGNAVFDGHNWPAHRLACKFITGEDMPQYNRCHACDVRSCVRVDHGFWGTQQENLDDMIAKGRSSIGKPRPSVQGHHNPGSKLTPEQVRSIRARLDSMESPSEIAHDFNINRETVRQIKLGNTWTYLE